MRSEISSLFISTILIANIFGAMTLNLGEMSLSSGRIIYVDDDNTSGIEDGSLAHPYNTIQEGVDTATSGDIVYVFNGTYYEHILISKSYLILQGENKNTTIIDGGGGGNVVNIDANWVNIIGFRIINGVNGIFLQSSSYSTITGNNISSNNWCGIFLSSSDSNNITNNNALLNYGHGFYISQSDSNTLIKNMIHNNSKDGIYLPSSSNFNTIENNTVYNNSDYGVRFRLSSNNNNLANNNIHNNSSPGIHLYHSFGNTINNNIVTNSLWYGIELQDSSSNKVTNNIVYDTNTGDGIYLQSSSNDNILTNNIVFNNSNHGIKLLNSNMNAITNNTIINNPNHGIYLESSSNNRFYHNNIIDNTNQAYDNRWDNSWDNGYPSGGNYWSNYYGNDYYNGVNQDLPGSDGIGDTPHVFDYRQDNYPLMNPWYDGNRPPVANAGPDQTVFEGDIVYFNGSGSYDSDGTIVNYDWNFNDGSPHSNLENPRHIFNYAGNYTVTLIVTDDEGARGSDTCTIKVLTVIKPPVADAGPDQTVYEGDVVYFDGSDSYATVGAIKSLEWDFDSNVDSDGDGNTTNDVDATGAYPTHIYNNVGVYNVTLCVTAKVETNETQKVNQDVVFVMDSSGSMNWNDPDDLRIQAAKNYVDKLNPDDRAAVVDFDTEATLLPDGWYIGDHLSTNYNKIKNNLDLVDSEGGTHISTGLNLSNEELRFYGDPDNVPIIILLTDAQNTNPDDDEICINESRIAQERGIKIFTIGLSMDSNSTGEQLLLELARITGGKYFPAPNASYLEEIYKEISELVENVTIQEMSDCDNCEITVLSAIQPPVADAGEDQTVDEGDTVLINGFASYSPTGLIDRYEWDFESDGIYDYQETPGNAPDGTFDGKTSHVYGDNGEYTVTLRVTDDKNAIDTDTCVITVNNVDPTILSFADPTVDEGSLINITAEAWDPGSEDLTFTWEFDFGLTIINKYKNYDLLPDPYPSPWGIFPFSAMDSVEQTYGDDGVYSIILTVEDDDGGSCVYPIDITVNNVAPFITYSGPFTVDEAEPFDISVMATDSGSDDLTFTWEFQLGPTITNIFYNDGLAPDTYPSPNGTFPFSITDIVGHTYGDNGVYSITLTVEDDDGGTNSVTINFTVNNVAPTIQPFGPIIVDECSPFDMTAISSDLGSDDLIFTWELELGPTITNVYYNNGVGPDPSPSPWGAYPFSSSDKVGHTYGDNGVFTVTLTVEDDDGGSTVYTTNVTVRNVAPTVEIIEAYIYADISLRVAGEKWHSVDIYLYEEGSEIWTAKVTRSPGDPDEQKATLANVKLDMTKRYKAIVDYLPNDPRENGNVWGGNPVWIELKFPNGSMFRLHHTFNVRQSYWDSDHWNHIDPWEVDLNEELIGCPFQVKCHLTDPGSDDEILTFSYGSQTKNVTCLNDPPNMDPYPSPEINPVDFTDVTTLIFEGPGTIILTVEDDDGGTASTTFDLF